MDPVPAAERTREVVRPEVRLRRARATEEGDRGGGSEAPDRTLALRGARAADRGGRSQGLSRGTRHSAPAVLVGGPVDFLGEAFVPTDPQSGVLSTSALIA